MAQRQGLPTPRRLSFVIMGAVFALEIGLMGLFHQFPGLSAFQEGVLDAVILTLVMSPLLFVYLYKPLTNYISELELANQRITHQSQHDFLTGLPNRVLLEDRLQQAIYLAEREDKPLTLALINVMRVKEINETLGYDVGDLVLVETARRLEAGLRKSDTVARLGSNKFAIVLPTVDDESAILIAEKILALVEMPIISGEAVLDLEAYMGLAVYPHHGQEVQTLIRRADFTAQEARDKAERINIFSQEGMDDSARKLFLFGELRRAISSDALVIHYQPKLQISTGHVHSVEALVRWNHPERGLIKPDEFLPLAENTGLIKPMTDWVVNEVMRQCRAWNDAGIDVNVAVNLSPRNLLDVQLPQRVDELREHWGLERSQIAFEITESAIIFSPRRSMKVALQLSEMGYTIAIDDFGTGYSSLQNLKLLPIDELKIDKSFVMGMADNKDDLMIVRSTVALAHNLGIEAVAEGVEQEADLEFLQSFGCDIAQGYHISPPLGADAFSAWYALRAAPE